MTVPSAARLRRILAEHWHANWHLAATIADVGCEADRALYTAFGLTERPTAPRPAPERPKRRRARG